MSRVIRQGVLLVLIGSVGLPQTARAAETTAREGPPPNWMSAVPVPTAVVSGLALLTLIALRRVGRHSD